MYYHLNSSGFHIYTGQVEDNSLTNIYVFEDILSAIGRKTIIIHSRAVFLFDTVQVMVAVWACRTTFLICVARDLDICSVVRANFRASCTTAVAMQERRRLGEAGCKNQAEGYREYFHCGAIRLQLKLVPH